MLFHWVAFAAELAPRSALPEPWMFIVSLMAVATDGDAAMAQSLCSCSQITGAPPLAQSSISVRHLIDNTGAPTGGNSGVFTTVAAAAAAASGAMASESKDDTETVGDSVWDADIGTLRAGSFVTPFVGASSGLMFDDGALLLFPSLPMRTRHH